MIGAFNAYLCEVEPRPAGQLAAKTGLYIVPVSTDAEGSSGYARGDAQRLSDEYDYHRAHMMLIALVQNNAMRPSDLITTGIYLAALDRPIPQRPLNYAIFEISLLRTDQDVRDWLVTEQQHLELGEETATRSTTRERPSAFAIGEGLGDVLAKFLRISGTAKAATVPCMKFFIYPVSVGSWATSTFSASHCVAALSRQ